MHLRELQAAFIQDTGDGHRDIVRMENSDGIRFLCPLCYGKNNGPAGTHSVLCWWAGRVSDDRIPGPGRWIPQGTSIDDLTFVPGDPPRSVSVHLTGNGCGWHGHIRNGEATLT